MSGAVSAGFGGELDRMLRQTDEQLGAAGRRVAKFIDENRQTVLASSAAALGGCIGTSDATVLRTINSGLRQLADLKQAILKSATVSTPADDMRRTLVDSRSRPEKRSRASCRPMPRIAVLQSENAARRSPRLSAFSTAPNASPCSGSAFVGTRELRFNLADPKRPLQPYHQRDRLDAGGSAARPRRGDALLILAYGRLYREVRTVFTEARALGCHRPGDRSR